MAKGDRIGGRPLAGKKLDEVRSVEDFEKEFSKVDGFVEELGKDTDGNFQIYKEGFWPKFVEALEARYNRDVRPKLNLPFEDRQKDFFAPDAIADVELEERFLHGGAQLTRVPHVFSVRFVMRGAFQELVEAGVLNQDDQIMFMQAMPHWEPGMGGTSNHAQGKLLSEMLTKEINARNNLSATLNDRGMSEKVDRILEHYAEKLGNFWGAVRGYPETFDETKAKEDLYKYGLYNREILGEIDRVAVEEHIQHTWQKSTAELRGISPITHDLRGKIVSEIEHGFTHASHIPGSFSAMDKSAREEINSVLGERA